MVEIVCDMNMNLYVLQNISDQNICFLQNFIKTNPKEICEIFVYENDWIENINIYVKSKISQTNHSTVNQGTFWKARVSSEIQKKYNFFFQVWLKNLVIQDPKTCVWGYF